MKDFKGTKGGWELDPHDATIIRSTNSDNGNIAECHAPNDLCDHIAYVQDGTHWGEDHEIAEANAQLIAAAPDMLDALLYFKDCVESWSDAHNDVKEKVEQAINKALGK